MNEKLSLSDVVEFISWLKCKHDLKLTKEHLCYSNNGDTGHLEVDIYRVENLLKEFIEEEM